MRLGARRPSGAWRALKSGLFGAAPGRTPPAGRRWPCFTGHGGQAQSVSTFSEQEQEQVSVLTIDTIFRLFSHWHFVLRQCRQDFGGGEIRKQKAESRKQK